MNSKKIDVYIKKYLAGEKETFDIIYKESYNYVFLTLRSLVNDNEIIKDLIQDTYMLILDKLDKYTIGTNFYAWVSKLTRNNAINYLKKNSRIIVKDSQDEVFNVPSYDSKFNYYVSYLDQKEKEIIIYKLVLGMNYKTISKIIGISEKSIYYYYKKALKKIKEKV